MTLYLKYRPTSFDSLVWQEFIKNTLKKAVENDKLVWAYLFCWPRWTGKTSTARIFAKTINCLNLNAWNPCLECEICKDFSNDALVDIIEIDAASHTWVDNVREIIERAKFMPTKCKYKVYIIDEVHMLSKWAFNALLKILEEPPKHLKFILATTESHKIPETILSRCQRYDFKSITNDDLKNRLKYIASEENIKIDEKSLDFIAKEANWGLRNAISLFEQLIKSWEIIFENVLNDYGIPETQKIENFYFKLLNKDESVLNDFDEVSLNYNLNLFIKELLFFIKDKLLEDLNANNFVNKIYLLETLEEAFLKSKNSFDSKTTFLVWILKCLKWKEFFEKQVVTEKPIITEKKVTKIEESKPRMKKEEVTKEEKTQEITHDDLFEVFWDVLEISDIPKKEDKKEPEKQTNSSWNFPKDDFIVDLKKNWAKWALTMCLRWTDFIFSSDKLVLNTKTKIAQNQLNDTENIVRINESLKNIWYENISLEIN